MTSEYKKFIKSFIIVLSLFIVIDLGVEFICNHLVGTLKLNAGHLSKEDYRLNKSKEDIMFIGPSTTNHSYVVKVFKDSLFHYTGTAYTVFNAGIDGCFLDCSCCAVESILQRYNPKLIILDARDFNFENKKDKDRLLFLSTFYSSNRVVKRYINNLGWKVKIKMIFNSYQFNESLLRLIKNSSKFDKSYDGYDALYGAIPNWKELEYENGTTNYKDEFTVNNFIHILQLCKERNVELIVTTPPRYKSLANNSFTRFICEKYNVPYINYQSSDYFNQHPELFKDREHLNDKGANIYTKMFFEKIKPYLHNLEQ